MKKIVIDFAPRTALPRRTGWLAGGAGAMLAVVASSAWLVTVPPVEASHMVEAVPRQLPGADEARAIDAAVRELNLPWLALLDALATEFGQQHEVVLSGIEVDVQRGGLRLQGEARAVDAVQALPARLRARPPIADAILVGQELQAGNTAWPVRFVLELRLREEG